MSNRLQIGKWVAALGIWVALAAPSFAQLFWAGAAYSGKTALNIFRFDILIQLCQTALEVGLLRLQIG